MTPTELLKTIYLGDRACKMLCIEGWTSKVVVQVDVISRIRSATGTWDYYTDEDIPDGRLVFCGVRQVRIDPPGPLPNDLINELAVTECADTGSGRSSYLFTLSVGSVDEAGASTEVTVEIEADDLHIIDPRVPGTEIKE